MELTNEDIQRRLETTASGTYSPHIPGLEGLVFVKMGLKEKGQAARAYSAKLKELYAAGGYFSEAAIPTVLEKVCKDNFLDIGVLKKRREITKRFYDEMPEDLRDPVTRLTDEEIAEKSPEEQADIERRLQERGRRIMEWMNNFYTEEDKKILAQAEQIEQLEAHIKANTAEHHARVHRTCTELLLCARRQDDINKPYFASMEEIDALAETNNAALVQLFTKWQQFKEGLLPDYFRTGDSLQPGMVGGIPSSGGEHSATVPGSGGKLDS